MSQQQPNDRISRIEAKLDAILAALRRSGIVPPTQGGEETPQ